MNQPGRLSLSFAESIPLCSHSFHRHGNRHTDPLTHTFSLSLPLSLLSLSLSLSLSHSVCHTHALKFKLPLCPVSSIHPLLCLCVRPSPCVFTSECAHSFTGQECVCARLRVCVWGCMCVCVLQWVCVCVCECVCVYSRVGALEKHSSCHRSKAQAWRRARNRWRGRGWGGGAGPTHSGTFARTSLQAHTLWLFVYTANAVCIQYIVLQYTRALRFCKHKYRKGDQMYTCMYFMYIQYLTPELQQLLNQSLSCQLLH